MQYPDGKEIRIDDLIWADEGIQIGRIVGILETEAEYAAWEESGPCILYTQDIFSSGESGALFSLPANLLAQEGIRALTEDERLLLRCLCRMLADQTGHDIHASDCVCHIWKYPVPLPDGACDHRWCFHLGSARENAPHPGWYALDNATLAFSPLTDEELLVLWGHPFYYITPATGGIAEAPPPGS